MDGQKYRDAVNDAALDREIESLLAVEPSPEFVVRVRTRVAAQPEPVRWRLSWMLASAAAAAGVVVILITWPSPEVTSAPDAIAQGPPGVENIAQPASTSSLAAPEPPRAGPASGGVVSVASRERVIEIDVPAVVVAENEVSAYSALVASIRQSRFEAAVPSVPNPDTPIEIKELPPVEPLEIEPIVRVAALQSEGERP